MIAEIGQFCLALALLMALVQTVLPTLGRALGKGNWSMLAPGASLAVFFLVLIAFSALVSLYVGSDFSVINVWQNSHQDMPLLYKVTGTWGNHEGSMLLWVLVLTFCSAAVAFGGYRLPPAFYTSVLSVQGLLSALFVAFLTFTSNPFARHAPVPDTGRDLNPILQDIGLALHPPLLYLGYVGFSIAFSFAMAALIEGKVDGAWARWVRPWTLFAWITLTLGIALGSYWAYYELGWGGWWFWDPVENASLLPWLVGTALLHMVLVVEKRESLKTWTIFLAITAFLLSLLGTFLVRSGVLTSVHSFASDPVRGLYILAILSFISISAFALFAWRAALLKEGGRFALISREGALILNNVGLVVSCLTVLIGTLYPLIIQLFQSAEGTSLTVGAPFYEVALYPIALLILILVPLGPLLAWKKARVWTSLRKLWWAALAMVAASILFFIFAEKVTFLALLGFALGTWLLLGGFAEIVDHAGIGRLSPALAWRRFLGLKSGLWASAVGHAGLGICLLGLAVAGSHQSESIVLLTPGKEVPVAGKTLRFIKLDSSLGPNYRELIGEFELLEGGSVQADFTASKRFYPARRMTTTEAGILTQGFSQIYVSLGDAREEGSISARIYHKPFVLLIWLGALVMALGGTISLFSRRRVKARSIASSKNDQPAQEAVA